MAIKRSFLRRKIASVKLIAINDINLAGAPFDAAMDALIGVQDPEVEFTLFRGTTDDLKRAVGGC